MSETALKQAAPAHTAKYQRLTRSDVGVLLKLHKDGLTQVQIAQRLGCTQPTVAKWLKQFTDTTDPAKEYLRGSALRMAKNIVQKGLARDHVATLKGIGVLQDEQAQGFSVSIGGLSAGADVKLALQVVSPPLEQG